jgi:hypothetical protein
MNKRKYGVSSRDYKYVRELYALTPIDEETRQKRKKIIHTKEWNEKISKTLKNHLVLDETRQKISASNLGRIYGEEARKNYKKGNQKTNLGVIHSEESRRRVGEKLKGKTAWNKGRLNCFSEEAISIMVLKARNRKKIKCEYCGKEIHPGIYKKCHGNRCKNAK